MAARVIESMVAAARPALGGWIDDRALAANLRAALETLRPVVSAPHSGPADLGQSEVLLVDGAALLVQPMTHAESRPSPHVVVWHVAGGDAAPDALARAATAALARFAPAGAQRVALFAHGGPESPMSRRLAGDGRFLPSRFLPYKRWVAAPLAELRAREPQPLASRMRATTPVDLDFWPDYERMYREFWASSPELRDVIGMESPADLELYRSHGGLRLVWIDGELAGLLGAVRLAEVGLRGWRLRERVLGARWRGAGFAAAALEVCVRDLAEEPGDCVWGTILPENVGSMRSALKVGRVDVGGLWWVGGEGVRGEG